MARRPPFRVRGVTPTPATSSAHSPYQPSARGSVVVVVTSTTAIMAGRHFVSTLARRNTAAFAFKVRNGWFRLCLRTTRASTDAFRPGFFLLLAHVVVGFGSGIVMLRCRAVELYSYAAFLCEREFATTALIPFL